MPLFSIESLPDELVLQILDLLPPRSLFQSAVLVSTRWKTLVEGLFLPHGRPGIVAHIGKSVIRRAQLVERNKPERIIDGFWYSIEPADSCSIIEGCKVVANLQLMGDEADADVSRVNIAALCESIDEEGYFVFCGVSSVRLDFWAPWRGIDELATWLEKVPITGSGKVWIEQRVVEQLAFRANRWSFPSIKDLHVQNLQLRTLRLNRELGFFPKLHRLSLEITDGLQDPAQDVLAVISLLTGTAVSICTIEELRLPIGGQFQTFLHATARISASLARLKKVFNTSLLNWTPLVSDAFGMPTGIVGANQLTALESTLQSLPDDPATILSPFSKSLTTFFPFSEELTLIVLIRPTDILLRRILWTAFVDFIKEQPARRIWLKFHIVDGSQVFGENGISRNLRRILTRFEGEVRKGLMDQSDPIRVLSCGFWVP